MQLNQEIQEMSEKVLKNLIENSRQELPFSLNPKHLKELLPHGETKIYQMLERGEIPAKKIGGRWIIQRDQFLIWYHGKDLNQI
jgi:excisionase family DNA binding protein